MLIFIEKMFIGLLSVFTLVRFRRSLPSNYKEPMKSVSLISRPGQARPKAVSINSDKTLFPPSTISFNKCGG